MPIVTETELRDKIRVPRLGVVLSYPPGTRFSPSAQDFIKQWRIEIRQEQTVATVADQSAGCSSG
jgi:ethanolamine utilization cobalamin adenosyltransferase